jgi:hypothetical protein
MSILTVLDVQDLCLGNQTASSLGNLLSQAQSLAEGPDGAHRCLEKKEHTEQLVVNSSGIARLSLLPLEVSENNPITISSRGVYLGDSASPEWIDLDSSKYEVDIISGEIIFNPSVASSYLSQRIQSFSGASRYNLQPRRQRRVSPQIRAKYFSGWDFRSSDLDPVGVKIKEVIKTIALLLVQLNASQTAQGLAGIASKNWDMSNLQEQLKAQLLIMQQWRPRRGG